MTPSPFRASKVKQVIAAGHTEEKDGPSEFWRMTNNDNEHDKKLNSTVSELLSMLSGASGESSIVDGPSPFNLQSSGVPQQQQLK